MRPTMYPLWLPGTGAETTHTMKPFHRDLTIAVSWFVFDQLTKYAASRALADGSVLLVENFLRLTLSHNRGALFGAFNDLPDPWRLILLAGIPILAVVGIFLFLMRVPRNESFARLGLALILGGAVGNVLDRLIFGYVVDFISVHWSGWYFPAFNIADAAISVGAAMLVLDLLLPGRLTTAAGTAGSGQAEDQSPERRP